MTVCTEPCTQFFYSVCGTFGGHGEVWQFKIVLHGNILHVHFPVDIFFTSTLFWISTVNIYLESFVILALLQGLLFKRSLLCNRPANEYTPGRTVPFRFNSTLHTVLSYWKQHLLNRNLDPTIFSEWTATIVNIFLSKYYWSKTLFSIQNSGMFLVNRPNLTSCVPQPHWCTAIVTYAFMTVSH